MALGDSLEENLTPPLEEIFSWEEAKENRYSHFPSIKTKIYFPLP